MLKEFNFYRSTYYLPALILIVFFATEFVSKILKFNNTSFDRISGLVKLSTEIFIVIYLYKKRRENLKTLLRIFCIFFTIYLAGHIFLLPGFSLIKFTTNLYSLNGYLFIFVLFYALYPQNLFQERVLNCQLKYLGKALKIIFIINSFAILLGVIFSIDFFQTYLFTNTRFGFNGMYLHASHSSYIYCIYILYFYNLHTQTNTKSSLSFFLCSISVSFIIATKTILFFDFLFLIYLLHKELSMGKFFAVLSGLILFMYSIKAFVFNIFINKFKTLYNLYMDEGLITMVFSTRDQSLSRNLFPYINEKWRWVNFVFGGADFQTARTEFEIIDLFWFFRRYNLCFFNS